VLAVIRDGVPVVEVASRFGVLPQAVHRWLRWYEDQGGRRGCVRFLNAGRPSRRSARFGTDSAELPISFETASVGEPLLRESRS
jgi:transposase-like protein